MAFKSLSNHLKKVLVLFSLTTIVSSCKKNNTLSLNSIHIKEDNKFGSATLDITIDKFNEAGFNYGDSCNVKFSNGYELLDVPYFNGFYVKNAAPVIVSYPSSEYVLITLNNEGIWQTASLSNECTVDISLNTAKKYLATQEALGQSYSLNRSTYSSDEEFSNFRPLAGGKLKTDLIYRGASPVDNSRNRAKYTDSLLEKNKVNCIIDLADSKDDMDSYLKDTSFESNYTKSIYEKGNMILLSMGSGYTSSNYKMSVVSGLKHLVNNDGPYYIHCMEGKDRTGFVCTLIEALAGASYQEMCDDYMMTYKNYYKISKEETPEKYDAVVALYFDSFMEALHKTSDVAILKSASYVDDAKNYLKEGGMLDTEIENLIDCITTK